MMKLVAIALSISAFTFAACSKDDKDSKSSNASKPAAGDKSDTSAKADKAKKPSKGSGPETVAIEKLGIKVTVPQGSTVGDGVGGDGVMIQGPDLVVMIELATDMTAATIDAAKEEADMYSPKNLESETLADGWVVTFDNTGGMGTNYFVNVRRELGGKAYWCTTTSSTPEQKANAIAACKSLAL